MSASVQSASIADNRLNPPAHCCAAGTEPILAMMVVKLDGRFFMEAATRGRHSPRLSTILPVAGAIGQADMRQPLDQLGTAA